jgi:NAD(P)-dependent dehydrogenase (short-subunit alcohol dehydrogenase family)
VRFTGRTLFATGAGSGIAAAAARRFTAEGGRVAVVDLDLAQAGAVADELDGAIAIAADVSGEAAVLDAVHAAWEQLGRIDCVLNAAGHGDKGPLAEYSIERWNRMLGVHPGGAFLVCKCVIPIMRVQGSGSIVNVSSIAAVSSQPDNAAYGAAKAAIVALSRHLALDVAAQNIRVNVIAPGRVSTGLTRPSMLSLGDGDLEQDEARFAQFVAMKRVAEPEELAGPICFLLSDDASFVTGSVLIADGGETIS